MRSIDRWVEDGEKGVMILVGGDFNARTGREEGRLEEVKEERRRNSRDEKVNREDRKLVEFIEKRGCRFNGTVEGDI